MSTAGAESGARVALVTGGRGQVGRALGDRVPVGWRCVACDSASLDVTQPAEVGERIARERPDVVINAAAFTAVDAAESDVELAHAVNVDGAANVARAAHAAGAKVIHLSTDFVFDGAASRAYLPSDATNPLSVYGRTKRDSEQAVRETDDASLIVRTAWVYAAEGRNFVLTMLRLMRERPSIDVVDDQVGTPTWAVGLADALWRAAACDGLRGTVHWTDAGVASWYDFAVAIHEEALQLGLLRRPTAIRPVPTTAFPTPAARPAFSVLDKRESWPLLGGPPPHWRVQLRTMLRELAGG